MKSKVFALSKVDRSNIRRRILIGMVTRNITIPALATYLGIGPREVTSLMTDAGTFTWLKAAPGFVGVTLLERCAKLLKVPVDVLMPWSDPLPLIDDLMPQMTIDFPKETWRKPDGDRTRT